MESHLAAFRDAIYAQMQPCVHMAVIAANLSPQYRDTGLRRRRFETLKLRDRERILTLNYCSLVLAYSLHVEYLVGSVMSDHTSRLCAPYETKETHSAAR
jgi:hypothetical protein